MELFLYPSGIKKQTAQIRNFLDTVVPCYLQAEQAIREYKDNEKLNSMAWEASKESMYVCYQLIMQGILHVQDSITNDLDILDKNIGDEELIESVLKNQLAALDSEIQGYQNSIHTWNNLKPIFSFIICNNVINNYNEKISQAEAKKAVLQEKLQKLYDIEASTKTLLVSAIDLLRVVKQIISGGEVNENTVKGNTELQEILSSIQLDIKEEKEKQLEPYLKYINEELFGKLGIDIDKMKEAYGEDILQQIIDCLIEYNIENEYSIACFLGTITIESFYGKANLELGDGGGSYTNNVKGAGLIQVTGYDQQAFLSYILEKENEKGEEKDEVLIEKIQIYYDNFYFFTKSNGTKCIDNLALTVEYGKYEDLLNEKTCAQFIAETYPVESAVWYWAKNKKMTYESGKASESIDSFVTRMSDQANNYRNLFLFTQMKVNGTRFGGDALEKFCQYEEDCQVEYVATGDVCSRGESHFTNYCFTVQEEPDRHGYGPRNWKEREDAWKILEEQIHK